ncbi:MAG: hypothetical protein Q9160_002814 [Pyrenula sp. 1 TL-2023]
MRACEEELAKGVLEPMFTFMRAQTSKERLSIQTLDHYLLYRRSDVGQAYEKELLSAQNAHLEGGALCNAVEILAKEVRLDTESAKRVLWALVREWEVKHESMVYERSAREDCGSDILNYMKGLEFHMSGNEAWSKATKRYQEVEA